METPEGRPVLTSVIGAVLFLSKGCVCVRACVSVRLCFWDPVQSTLSLSIKEIMLGLCFLLGLTTFLEIHGLSRLVQGLFLELFSEGSCLDFSVCLDEGALDS